jgi:outer membrane lipoprotein-sorting protein
MTKRYKMLAPFTLLVALAVTFSGCSVGAGQQVTSADVIAKMRETMKTTQTVQGTVDLSVTINKQGIQTLLDGMMPGGVSGRPDQPSPMAGKDWMTQLPDSASATLKVLKKNPDKVRIEVLTSSLPNAAGKLAVFDGTKFYAYDPDSNTVYTGTPDKMSDGKMGDMMGMMQGADLDKEIDKVLNAADIKMAGTEKVAGVDTYKLDVTPKPDAAELLDLPSAFQMQAGVLIKDVKATLWVDQSRWVPLKLVVVHPNIGEFTYTASGMELNKPIEDSQFVLQVPPGAKTVDLDATHDSLAPKTTTITEAREIATKEGWKLLEPTYLPENATLIEVRSLPNLPVRPILLTYSSPSTDFTIMQAKGGMESMLGDSFSGRNDSASATQNVTVRGVQAVAFSPESAEWTSLIWKEKSSDLMVAIRGKITVDEAVKIAEGLK